MDVNFFCSDYCSSQCTDTETGCRRSNVHGRMTYLLSRQIGSSLVPCLCPPTIKKIINASNIKIHILATVLVGKSIAGGICPKFRTHSLWVCKELCAKPKQDIRFSSHLELNPQSSASLQAFFLSNCLEHLGQFSCLIVTEDNMKH